MASAAKQPGGNRKKGAQLEDEQSLWAWAVREAKPLSGRPAPPQRPKTTPREEATRTQGSHRAPPANAEGALSARDTAGIDRRTADRFLRGRMEIDEKLDLHGMTQSEAHAALDRFLDRAIVHGSRCVLIVTGKGRGGSEPGVLRKAVPRWLNQIRHRGQILSFSPAQPKHGGEGALYVLLRRQRGHGKGLRP